MSTASVVRWRSAARMRRFISASRGESAVGRLPLF
jgi:hypothetical protein